MLPGRRRFKNPGIVVHGVALKPGKLLCLAVTGGKPVVVLPGFPTSAIFTFCEFVAPRLWEHPSTIDGAYTSNSPAERRYAVERSKRAIDIARVLDSVGQHRAIHHKPIGV